MSRDPIARLNAALAGRYAVEREIGAGGMATVYLARDQKHDRPVAIKVLAPDLSATIGAARFIQEIRIAAQLQHPHILGLIDSGHVGDTVFYVMPFVEGESLRDRLAVGPIPIPDAVRIIREVADGLSYAHTHGVVHRDIKPENVMLSGRHALIVDFGVAKALSDASDRQHLTTVGIALGTPTYMAPEQAAAEPGIDHRADIYALGIMAYEMLSGHPPFTGMSHQQVVAAHMTRTPPSLTGTRPAIAPGLEHVVMRCLAKDPADRYQSAEDVFAALEPHASSSGAVSARGASGNAGSNRRTAIFAAAVVGAVAVAAWFVVAGRPAKVRAFSIGKASQLTSDDGLEIQPALSPDGKLVAYAAGNSQRMRIFIRPVSGGRTIALSDDSNSVETQPRWSPDGNQLLFLSRDAAYVSPTLGGSERLVTAGAAGDAAVRSASWAPGGREVAIVRHDSLLIQPIDGGVQRLVGRGTYLHSCVWSADAPWIACVSGNPFALTPGYNFGNLAPSHIVLFPAAGGEPIRVTDGEKAYQSPLWSANEPVLYVVSNRDGPRDVYAITIGKDGRAAGAPRRVTTGLNAQSISLSSDQGQLAYSVYAAKSNIWAVPIPAGAAVTTSAAAQITSGSQVIELVHASRDGRWLVFDSDLTGSSEIYRMPIGGGAAERLTRDSLIKFGPDLTADGNELVYHAFGVDGHRQLYVKNLLTGVVQRAIRNDWQASTPQWSPDGSAIAAWDQSAISGRVFVVRRDARGQWQQPPRILATGRLPAWSPDGRVIAFTTADGSVALIAADSGPVRVLYAPTQKPGDPIALTVRWGVDPGIVYIKGRDRAGHGGIWSLAVRGGAPRLLVRTDDPARSSDRPDFTTDGKRFYFTIDDRQSDVWIAALARP